MNHQQTKLFESWRSEIAKQLKILQENKSAYEQMQKDYRRMMRKDTKAKEKAIEKRREALQNVLEPMLLDLQMPVLVFRFNMVEEFTTVPPVG